MMLISLVPALLISLSLVSYILLPCPATRRNEKTLLQWHNWQHKMVCSSPPLVTASKLAAPSRLAQVAARSPTTPAPFVPCRRGRGINSTDDHAAKARNGNEIASLKLMQRTVLLLGPLPHTSDSDGGISNRNRAALLKLTRVFSLVWFVFIPAQPRGESAVGFCDTDYLTCKHWPNRAVW